MAGHNKWSKIKRQKAKADKRKSKIWARLSRDITVAAREGGGDPEMNASLSMVIDKAKAENMPKDNIERAIKRGTGEIQGEDYEEVTYEGYGPNGVAVFVESLTDNTNRTVADIRHVFSKAGGSLGKSGSVGYLFERKGMIEVPVAEHDELEVFEIVAEAGAEDLQRQDDTFVITTPVDQFVVVESALKAAGIDIEEATLYREPTTTVTLSESESRKVVRLIEQLEELQDVQAVFTTLEMNGEPVAAVSSEDTD
ncbi:MAG: YebC/PmpR family DNA-binding transcriptional regulator [Rhodothermales bacterium]